MTFLGSPSSDLEGISIERGCAGKRITVRAWVSIHGVRQFLPSQHFTREEFAHFIGAEIPKVQPKKPRSWYERAKARLSGEMAT